MRAIVKIRRVFQSLVVTLAQSLLGEVELQEGDRVLIEAAPPRRIIISKEVAESMPNTRQVELELEALETQKTVLQSDITFKTTQWNKDMPVQEDMPDDEATMELTMRQLDYEIAKLDAEIAKKRLDLFELQGQ